MPINLCTKPMAIPGIHLVKPLPIDITRPYRANARVSWAFKDRQARRSIWRVILLGAAALGAFIAALAICGVLP
jgi:hypothetical protein